MNLFSQFSLPQISVVARRTVLVGCGVGLAALVVGVLTGYPLAGLGVCMGLAIALVNFRLISRATLKASSRPEESHRRPLALNTLGRMGVISVVALGVTFFVRQLGFGILLGLAAFQFTLLANVVVSMLRDPLVRDTTLGTALADEDDDA